MCLVQELSLTNPFYLIYEFGFLCVGSTDELYHNLWLTDGSDQQFTVLRPSILKIISLGLDLGPPLVYILYKTPWGGPRVFLLEPPNSWWALRAVRAV